MSTTKCRLPEEAAHRENANQAAATAQDSIPREGILDDLESIIGIHQEIVELTQGVVFMIRSTLKNACKELYLKNSEFKAYQTITIAVLEILPVISMLQFY